MHNYIIKELSKINFEELVLRLVEIIATKNEPRLIFVGIGKNAYVAKRLTASFVSMNVSCCYLNAVDALHGDIGIVNSNDICILLSHSGETSEMIDLARHLRKRNCGILCVTNKSGSSLSRLSDNSIFLNCSNGMPGFEKIPSVSLYAMEILFDLFLIDHCTRKKKCLLDFSYNHPSGGIGSWFATPIKEIAKDVSDISIEFDSSLDNISYQMDCLKTRIVYIKHNNKFVGCLTSGDVRRLSACKYAHIELEDLNQNPIKLTEESSIQCALEVMKKKDISVIFVTNSNSEIVSFISIVDLIK